jgi:hypothetical protein
MLEASALAGLLLGALASLTALGRLDIGTTWRDWQTVDTPRWWDPFQWALIAAFFVAILGLGLPHELRALVIGAFFGMCLVFFITGVRRWRRAPRPDPQTPRGLRRMLGRDLPPAERPQEFPPSSLMLAAYVLGTVAVFLVLGESGAGELVAAAFLGAWLCIVHSFIDQVTDVASARRERHFAEDAQSKPLS